MDNSVWVPKLFRQESAFGTGEGKKRAYSQLCLLAAVGREARARRRATGMLEENAGQIMQFAEQHNAIKGARAPKLAAVQMKRRAWASGTAVRLQLRSGGHSADHRRRSLTAFEICCVCFDPRRNRHAAADLYRVSRQTVMRGLVVGAATLLEVQIKQLLELRDFVVSQNPKPDVASATLMWDETQQTLSTSGLQHSEAKRSGCTTLVARLHLTIGWLQGPGLKFWKDFVIAPMPLASNSAISIWSALRAHPMIKMLLSSVYEICMSAELRCFLHEADGHLSNEKLHFHTYQKEMADRPAAGLPLLRELVLCGNHQTNLILTQAINNMPKAADLSGKLLPNLYCASLWLRMGTHLLRLLGSLRGLLQKEQCFTWLPNPSARDLEEGAAYRKEVAGYLIDNLRHHQRQMSPSAAQGGPTIFKIQDFIWTSPERKE